MVKPKLILEDCITCRVHVGHNQYAIFDADDITKLFGYSWYTKSKKGGKEYVVANCTVDGKRIHIYMARIIMNVEDPKVQVDHIDLDTLNNRKSNLRLCTNAQNQFNRIAKINNKCGYKGVHFVDKTQKRRAGWVARIGVGNKRIRLGVFDTKEEAALVYNEAAKKYHGEFARFNPVGEYRW